MFLSLSSLLSLRAAMPPPPWPCQAKTVHFKHLILPLRIASFYLSCIKGEANIWVVLGFFECSSPRVSLAPLMRPPGSAGAGPLILTQPRFFMAPFAARQCSSFAVEAFEVLRGREPCSHFLEDEVLPKSFVRLSKSCPANCGCVRYGFVLVRSGRLSHSPASV